MIAVLLLTGASPAPALGKQAVAIGTGGAVASDTSIAPSSSGGSTVGEALNILSNFDLAHESRVQALHHYLEASRLAFADRNRYVGDPRFVNVPLRQLLSDSFARQRAA